MKKLNRVTDVFFDLDHTLWDFEKNSALTFNKIFEINQINLDLELFLEHYVPINFGYWKLYREERISKDNLRFGRLNDTFKALNVNVEAEKIYKLSADYIAYLTSYNHLIEYTYDILNYLHKKYSLHIITNGFDEVQQGKLDKSNIAHYFKTITNSEIAGVKKPNPEIFQFALRQANANIKSSVMIGDSYEADVQGALNVGMDAIFFSPKADNLNGTAKTISTLVELRDYL